MLRPHFDIDSVPYPFVTFLQLSRITRSNTWPGNLAALTLYHNFMRGGAGVACRFDLPEVAGSSPAPATT